MALVLFLLTFLYGTSLQHEVPDKNLHQILEVLKEETNISNEIKHLNNSKIIYVTQDNATRRNNDKSLEEKLNSLHSSQYDDFDDLVQILRQESRNETGLDKLGNNEERDLEDMLVEIENAATSSNEANQNKSLEPEKSYVTTHPRRQLLQNFEHNEFPFAAAINANLLHKHPEIIINKINRNRKKSVSEINYGPLNPKIPNEFTSKAIEAVIKLYLNEATRKGSLESADDILTQSDLEGNLNSDYLRSGYQHNLISKMPVVVHNGAPHVNMLVPKLPKSYRNLHHIIHHRRNPYLDSNLQLNRWGNAGQNSLMRISRAHQRSRVHFIPKPVNNFVRRFLYHPMYHYHI